MFRYVKANSDDRDKYRSQQYMGKLSPEMREILLRLDDVIRYCEQYENAIKRDVSTLNMLYELIAVGDISDSDPAQSYDTEDNPFPSSPRKYDLDGYANELRKTISSIVSGEARMDDVISDTIDLIEDLRKW